MIIQAALNNHPHKKNHKGLSEGSSDGEEKTEYNGEEGRGKRSWENERTTSSTKTQNP